MWLARLQRVKSSSSPPFKVDLNPRPSTLTSNLRITMETRRSPSPPPSFPNETKREILSFCDTPSLANASLVSLAFLELVSPFLYQHIAIQGLEQLSRLFHEEVSFIFSRSESSTN